VHYFRQPPKIRQACISANKGVFYLLWGEPGPGPFFAGLFSAGRVSAGGFPLTGFPLTGFPLALFR